MRLLQRFSNDTCSGLVVSYGPLAGMIAGFVHITLVSHVVVMHGGLNLYNNGFAGGFVAAVLVPIFEILKAFVKR